MGKLKITPGGGGADLDVVTAGAGDVLAGKVIVDKEGEPLVGTMTVNSILSFSAAAYGGKQILLAWQNPYAATGKPYSGVEIRYSTSGYPGTGGTVIYTGIGSNSIAGGSSQAIVTLPALGTTYYFSLRPYVNTSNGTMYGSVLNAYAVTAAELWLTFTSSQTYTIPAGYSLMDVFAVGGGGSSYNAITKSSGGGGAGGYTMQQNGLSVTAADAISIVVGAGGISEYFGKDGSPSIISKNGAVLTTANGGKCSMNGDTSNGGSGGGNSSDRRFAGRGGADGSNGYIGDYNSEAASLSNSKGQGFTTRAWGSGTLYSGGGGGGTSAQNTGSSPTYGGSGGAGGGGNGTGNFGTSGANGAANTGGGAGGGGYSSSSTSTTTRSNGGSGIVLLHVY